MLSFFSSPELFQTICDTSKVDSEEFKLLQKTVLKSKILVGKLADASESHGSPSTVGLSS